MLKRTLVLCRLFVLGAILVGSMVGNADAQVFLFDDPIWVDPDRLDMPAPEERTIGNYYDFWINTLASPGEYDGPALNVNTLGEVPNSSWYTNRHYHRPMAVDALTRGPSTVDGPTQDGPWRVVAGKTEGKTLGLQIEDARGDRYLLKFDPPGHIELTSGAEVIATKLLYALGYNVPENFPVRFSRTRLEPGLDAIVEKGDSEVRVTDQLIDELLVNAATYPDGSYRALASRLLEGEPIGPFFYYGTRPDDGNDIFPHEGRRELRGLRVISAWINHTDARGINSIDMIVEEDGRQFVRHHLIDFGSTFGAGPLGPKPRWDGFEYIIDIGAIATRVFTLGIAGLDWAGIEYPDLDAVGYIDAEHFDPEDWRPQYPNAAFRRADAGDMFWAAKKIAAFTENELRAIVSTAEYSSPAVEDRMLRILLERQDAIGRRYLGYAGGLDRFEVHGAELVFDDLRVRYRYADEAPIRRVTWRTFDNTSGAVGESFVRNEIAGTHVEIPDSAAPYLAVDFLTEGAGITRVYLRGNDASREVVGIDRLEP